MRVALGALGLDPTNSCYDANRPSWLPYWINDSVEQACLESAQQLTSAWAGFNAPTVNPLTLTPNLSTATSPGLPAGYTMSCTDLNDPTTCTSSISPQNTTGVTTINAPGYAAAVGQAAAQANTPPTWYCNWFGLGCKGQTPQPVSSLSGETMLVLGAIAATAIAIALFRR